MAVDLSVSMFVFATNLKANTEISIGISKRETVKVYYDAENIFYHLLFTMNNSDPVLGN